MAVVGDGPAGLALASAARGAGLDVVVVGRGERWDATYSTWRDEVLLPDECFLAVVPGIAVHGHRHHDIERAYGVLDNAALRRHLTTGLGIVGATADRIVHVPWGSRVVTDIGAVDARIVVDARGRPPGAAAATQTAYGLVVAERPPSGPVLMDLRPAGSGAPTFNYCVPVDGGWLIEETVLAARPAVPPADLAPRLAARIGTPAAVGTDVVTIPMGGPLPSRRGPVPAFGAAAGYVHPATGYSVAASLRAAPRVAAALAVVCRTTDRPDAAPVWDAVWPAPLRRTRRLHDYGLEVLLRLDQDGLADFFDAFFDLPVDVWAPYLRIDATPRQVSRTMTSVLRRLPRGTRRRVFVLPRRAAT